MLCSQREIQALGILTYIERDDCLQNSVSVWPMLLLERDCSL